MPLDQRKRVVDTLATLASFSGNLNGTAGASPGTFVTVTGTATIFDTGGGRTSGDMVVDVSYASLGSPDGYTTLSYQIILQGSDSATFGTPVKDLANVDLRVWDTGVTLGTTSGKNPGALVPPSDASLAARSLATVPFRVTIPFSNDYADTVYRYLRIWLLVEPSVASAVTGINFNVTLTKSAY